MKELKWLSRSIRVKLWVLITFIGWILSILSGSSFIIAQGLLSNGLPPQQPVFSVNMSYAVGVLGISMMITGLFSILRNVVLEVTNEKNARSIATNYIRRKQLEKGPSIVTIGGGTGLSTILSGLKNHSSNLTAIVTVADDGGSSGRLRKDLKILPPGDIRNCLISLARSDKLISRLLQYRFTKGEGLSGHSFGNLLIAALTDIQGSFLEAVRSASEVLAISGEVLPSTCQNVVLTARMDDGNVISGESRISSTKGRIKNVALEPEKPSPTDDVIGRIAAAQAIVLGPGSLYTSIIPNLLVDGICDAINTSASPVIYIANIMTQPGETDNFTLDNHIEALLETTELQRIDYILVNNARIQDDRIEEYIKTGAREVLVTKTLKKRESTQIIETPLLCEKGLIRHSPQLTAAGIIEIIEKHTP